jgi:integrase
MLEVKRSPRLDDAGVPTEAIADLLGHSSIAITAIYAKVVDMHKYTPSEVLNSLGG